MADCGSEETFGRDSMSAAHKDESPVSAGQFVKTLSKYAIDFIAATARYASANPEYSFLALVLAVQFVAMFGGH